MLNIISGEYCDKTTCFNFLENYIIFTTFTYGDRGNVSGEANYNILFLHHYMLWYKLLRPHVIKKSKEKREK